MRTIMSSQAGHKLVVIVIVINSNSNQKIFKMFVIAFLQFFQYIHSFVLTRQ